MSRAENTNLFGVKIDLTNLESAINFIKNNDFTMPGYICLPDVNLLVNANKNDAVKKFLNNSKFTFADGKPIEIYLRIKGHRNISTVSGYWLFNNLLDSNMTHYFYGTNGPTLKKIKNNIDKKYYKNILGYKAPPILQEDNIINNEIINNDINKINALKPDIIWVGLSSPKQDELMYHYSKSLDYGIMIGVGAVFDYIADPKNFSPEWMKKLSIRWVYRLFREPKKTSIKIIFSFPYFFYLIIRDIFKPNRK